jgi:SAM-dependent methyltransferase
MSDEDSHMALNFFDEHVAARYDDDVAAMFDPQVLRATVALLADLAGGGPALELGIGTGRVALPLNRTGVEVCGIELSTHMVERLRAKPGADRIDVVVGDFATARVGREFTLAYLVFNTIMNLTSQDAQTACFVNAAEHLVPGGHFVVEVAVPPLQDLPRGQTVLPIEVGEDYVGFDVIDTATQSLVSHHHHLDGDRTRRFSIPFRYVWPSELDLMARIAGLNFVDRWASWDREPFTNASTTHISVWRQGAAR